MIEELDSLIMDWTGASPGGKVIAQWLRIVLDQPQPADTGLRDRTFEEFLADQPTEIQEAAQRRFLELQAQVSLMMHHAFNAALAQYGFKVKP